MNGSASFSNIGAAALVLSLIAGPVLAQQGADPALSGQAPQQAPLSLVPQGQIQAPSAPSPSLQSPSLPPSFGPAGIAVQSLDAISTDTVGLLADDAGGLPVTMWQGTERALLDILLSRLPDRVRSPAMRDLTRRMLLTSAEVPDPPEADPRFEASLIPDQQIMTDAPAEDALAETPAEGDVLFLRMAQLAEMGDWTSVRTLFSQIPVDGQSSQLRQIRTDADLVDGNIEVACAEADQAVTEDDSAYWQKVLIFCQLKDGLVDEAAFGMALLQETGSVEPAFIWTAELMAGNRPLTPANLNQLTPLQLAMLRAGDHPVPADLVRAGDPTLLRMLALKPLPAAELAEEDTGEMLDEGLGDEVTEEAFDPLAPQLEDPLVTAWRERVLLAERALAVAAVSPQEVQELYSLADPITEDEQSIPLEQRAAQTPRDRALLYQVARQEIIPTAKAEVMAHAIELSQRRGAAPDIFAVAPVYADMIRALPTSPELLWFAGHAARALLAVDDPAAAEEWLLLVRTFSRTSSDAQLLEEELWPYLRLLELDQGGRWTTAQFEAWQRKRGPTRDGDVTLLYILLSAINDDVRTADWQGLLEAPIGSRAAMPTPADWFALEMAADQKRLAETVSLSALVMAGDLPSFVSPQTLDHVAGALLDVGLTAEARQLAVEAALARGF